MPLPLDYTSSIAMTPPIHRVRATAYLISAFSVVAFAEAAGVAFLPEGPAIAVMQLLTPALNFLLGVVALALIPVVVRVAPHTFIWFYVGAALASPVVATIFVLMVGAAAGVRPIVC